jgi:hypothetical protein
VFNRNYICVLCGTIRREAADYVPDGRPTPLCCERPMRVLGYERMVAASRMTKSERTEWIAKGGNFKKGTGRRRWKAT